MRPPGPVGGLVRPDRVQNFLFSNSRVQVSQCFTTVIFDPPDTSLTHHPLQIFYHQIDQIEDLGFSENRVQTSKNMGVPVSKILSQVLG